MPLFTPPFTNIFSIFVLILLEPKNFLYSLTRLNTMFHVHPAEAVGEMKTKVWEMLKGKVSATLIRKTAGAYLF
jgi:hypothetical protein